VFKGEGGGTGEIIETKMADNNSRQICACMTGFTMNGSAVLHPRIEEGEEKDGKK